MKKINVFISSILILSMFSNVGFVFAQSVGTGNTFNLPSTPTSLPTGPSSSAPTKTVLEKTGGTSCSGLNNFIQNSARLGSIKSGAQITISNEAHTQIGNLSNKLAEEVTKQSNSLIKGGSGAASSLFKKSGLSGSSFDKKSPSYDSSIDPDSADFGKNAIDATPKVGSSTLTGKETRVDKANATTAIEVIDNSNIKATNNNTEAINQSNASITTALVASDKTKQQQECNDLFAYYTNKGVLADTIKTTTNWINTGNAGTPFYVLDQSSYYKSIFRQTLDKTINSDTSNDYLGGQINKLLISQMTGKTPNYRTNSTDPAAIAAKNFNSDFKNGGWDSWINTSMGDNPISRYLSTVNNLARESNDKQQIARDELNQGGGFLSQKTCVEYTDIKDSYGNLICKYYSTSIPGSIIKAQAEVATTTHVRQLELADKMNQTLGGIFDDMFNRLLSGGFTSMQGATGTNTTGNIFNSSGGFGVNAIIGSQGNILSGFGGSTNGDLPDAYQYSLGSGQGVTIDTIVNTGTLAQILKDQYAITNRLEDNVIISKRLLENTGKLDYFYPGPNVGSVQYVVDNLDKVSNALPQYTSQYFMTGEDVKSYFNSKGLPTPDWPAWAIPVIKNPAAHFSSDNGASSMDHSLNQIETLMPYLTYQLGDPITNSYIKYEPWYVLSFFNVNSQNKSDTQSNGKGENAAIGSSVGSAAGAALGSIIPGVGTVIGGALGNLFGGLLGGLFGSNDEHSWYQRDPIERDSVENALGIWLDDYWARVSETFSTDNLIALYLRIDKDNTAGDIRGFVKDAKIETDNLINYNLQAIGIETTYKDNIDTIQQNTAELEEIYTRVQEIVSKAKTRHIAQMAAQGITVNTQCLNKTYYTGSTPTPTDAGIARKEIANDPDLADLEKYQTNFYNNLCSAQSDTVTGALADSKIKNICEAPKKVSSTSTSTQKQNVCFKLDYKVATGNNQVKVSLITKDTQEAKVADTSIELMGSLQTSNGSTPFEAVFAQGNSTQIVYLPTSTTIYDASLKSVVPGTQSIYNYNTSCY